MKTAKEFGRSFSTLAITMVGDCAFCPIPLRKFVIPFSNNDGWLSLRQTLSAQKRQSN
jgi:hypothetical protein